MVQEKIPSFKEKKTKIANRAPSFHHIDVVKTSMLPLSWDLTSEKLSFVDEENKSLFVFNTMYPQFTHALSIDPRLPIHTIFNNIFNILKVASSPNKLKFVHVFRDIIITPNNISLYVEADIRLQNLLVRKSYQALLLLHLCNKLVSLLDDLKEKDFLLYKNILTKFLTYVNQLSINFDTSKSTPDQVSFYKLKIQSVIRDGYTLLNFSCNTLETFITSYAKTKELNLLDFDSFIGSFCFTNAILKHDDTLWSSDINLIGELLYFYYKDLFNPEFLSENKDQKTQLLSYCKTIIPLIKLLYFYGLFIDNTKLSTPLEYYVLKTRNLLRINSSTFFVTKELSKNKYSALLSVFNEVTFSVTAFITLQFNKVEFVHKLNSINKEAFNNAMVEMNSIMEKRNANLAEFIREISSTSK